MRLLHTQPNRTPMLAEECRTASMCAIACQLPTESLGVCLPVRACSRHPARFQRAHPELDIACPVKLPAFTAEFGNSFIDGPVPRVRTVSKVKSCANRFIGGITHASITQRTSGAAAAANSLLTFAASVGRTASTGSNKRRHQVGGSRGR